MLSVLIALACSDPPPAPQPVVQEQPPPEPLRPGELRLSRNDGEKWVLDAPTRAAVEALEQTLHGKVPMKVEEANAIGDDLWGQLDTLLAECTLKGPARQQIDHFVSAFRPEVVALQRDTTLIGARARVLRLQQMVFTLKEYVE
ncbi:MAG: hypothetical protein H6737_29655 [Alphaproteobacteria bacterium]|nr:hypothetical protein [Alphaproteobacteria bacterium]